MNTRNSGIHLDTQGRHHRHNPYASNHLAHGRRGSREGNDMQHTRHLISRSKRLRTILASALLGLGMGLFWTSPAIGAVAQSPLLVTSSVRPNILLIPDTSESMQEEPGGRLALDRDNPACQLGPDLDPDVCPAGARSPNSKASIIKRVGLDLVDNFQGRANLGLLSYQQNPPSVNRDDFNSGGTVRWRLVQRAVDVRYSTDPNPTFYDPDFDGAWDADTKRFRDPHPTEAGIWLFYNVAVPGYDWVGGDPNTGVPETDRTMYLDWTGTMVSGGDAAQMNAYDDIRNVTGGTQEPDSGLRYQNHLGTFNVFLVDSLRQRGIGNWGQRLAFMPANQLEWRTTTAPGLGYLHVPIGGLDQDGVIDEDHWNAIRAKLQPQRHNWDSSSDVNPMTDPDWPLIAAGLTPLEGTFLTARDYLLGNTNNFGSGQGNNNVPDLPESCNANSIIWLTDGLPSAGADGTSLGDNPSQAFDLARAALADLYEETENHFGEPVNTHVVGFALPPGVANLPGMRDIMEDHLDDPDDANLLDVLAVAGGTGRARMAQDEAGLQQLMSDLLAQIVQDAQSSSASIATNSTRLDTDTLIYQARFDTTDWSGQIRAFQLEADGRVGDEVWDASQEIPPSGSRNIFTWDNEDDIGRLFRWADLTPGQQAALNRDRDGIVDDLGEQRLAWLRGSAANEGTLFRTRTQTVLGSVVNSDPAIAGNQSFGFAELPGEEGSTYNNYVQEKSNRREVLYFGANDGMLHGVDASSEPGQGGREVLAYVPNAVYDNLSYLTDTEYNHHFYVDGAPTVSDAWNADEEEWRTVLVGTTGAGGGGVFALDVTDPDSFDRHDVLWEFTDEDMHHSTSQPSVVRLADGRWVALFGNGYGEGAHLYVVELFSGNLIEKITLVDGGENGLATPAPVSLRGQNRRIANTVYAGDMQGNMWRIDLGAMRSEFGSGGGPNFTPDPLFTARGPGGEVQPITSRPALTLDPDGDIVILFGTGAFFRTSDAQVPANQNARDVQSFYGLRDTDNGEEITGNRDNVLQQQEIIAEGNDFHPFDFDLRVTTGHEAGERGWYLDLISPVEGRQTERVVSRALVRGDRVIFVTMIPDDEPCGFGGESWLMEMQAFSGSRLDVTPFDLDGDGNFDEGDWVEVDIDGETVRVPVSGLRSEVGVIKTPGVVGAGDREHKYVSGSSGEIGELPDESTGSVGGRQSWQQLR